MIIWQPFAHGSVSMLGHVSFNINGKNWSFEKAGWDQGRPFSEYLKENTWRDGFGYVLDDENDPMGCRLSEGNREFPRRVVSPQW